MNNININKTFGNIVGLIIIVSAIVGFCAGVHEALISDREYHLAEMGVRGDSLFSFLIRESLLFFLSILYGIFGAFCALLLSLPVWGVVLVSGIILYKFDKKQDK